MYWKDEGATRDKIQAITAEFTQKLTAALDELHM